MFDCKGGVGQLQGKLCGVSNIFPSGRAYDQKSGRCSRRPEVSLTTLNAMTGESTLPSNPLPKSESATKRSMDQDGVVLFGKTQIGDDDIAWVYLSTQITITVDGEGLSASQAVKRLGAPLHLVTAWTPGGERPTDLVNSQNNLLLQETLVEYTNQIWIAVGNDAESPHQEDGFAFAGVDRATAIAIGEEYRQVAIFELTETQQIVLSCDNTWAVARAIP